MCAVAINSTGAGGKQERSDWLYRRWSLARLLEERMLELNLYVGIGICQIARR